MRKVSAAGATLDEIPVLAKLGDAPEKPGLDEIEDERNAIQGEKPVGMFFEFAPAFLTVEDPTVEYLVNDLLPRGVIALAHGEPRTCKSWAALEIAIAVATGTTAFGLDRFSVPKALPVLYSSQEDGARDIRIRAKALLRGRGIERYPDMLAFAVHKGIYFESTEWQEILRRNIATFGFALVIFDPIRRFSVNVDKGPAEVRAITGVLRRLVVETGATLMPTHHDVKPPASGPDTRRRSHRASGGDWFAAAECPMSFETAGESGSLVIPEDYKFSSDPQPFSFRVESDDPKYPTVARLVGNTTASVVQAEDIVAQEKILSFLGENNGASGTRIAKGCRMHKGTILGVLKQLEIAGKVDSVKADKKGKATTWFIKKAE